MKNIDAEFYKIPAWSPDLNAVQNIFHLNKKNIENEAIVNNIASESFEVFSTRVLKSFENLSTEVNDQTISTLENRVEAFIKCKGKCIKY